MILQALYDYYQRKAASLPPIGFELKELKFIIVMEADGTFVDLVDTREGKTGHQFLLPKSNGRSGSNAWKTAFLLWDHYGYVLGHPKDNTPAARKMAARQHNSFIEKISNLPEEIKRDKGVVAVLAFYERNQQDALKKHPNWNDCSKIPGCNLSFRINGEGCLVPERSVLKKYQASIVFDNEEEGDNENRIPNEGRCLITGEFGPIARLHTATPIRGSKSNAKIVGFQRNSGFDSYNKQQAYNAPVSIKAESEYTTALKHIINSEKNRVMIGGDTILFWAETKPGSYDFEKDFPWFLTDAPKDDPERGVRAVKGLYQAIHTGKLPLEEDVRFYVLGLAPNIARISVRFWRVGTIGEFATRIKRYFEDLEIVRGSNDHEYLSLNQVLRATAFEYQIDKVPPNLAGSVMSSILDGTPYPITFLQQCIRRIRAEHHVNRARAAILKAYLNRSRESKDTAKEVSMSLDRNNMNTGYRLGRLFAVLEKIQEEANPGINSTIRDRFYGAASSSPVAVFSQLLTLKNHHLAKLDNPGRRINFERELGEIFDGLHAIPAHLPLEEQARFAVGYYHQRQSFFTKNEANN